MKTAGLTFTTTHPLTQLALGRSQATAKPLIILSMSPAEDGRP